MQQKSHKQDHRQVTRKPAARKTRGEARYTRPGTRPARAVRQQAHREHHN